RRDVRPWFSPGCERGELVLGEPITAGSQDTSRAPSAASAASRRLPGHALERALPSRREARTARRLGLVLGLRLPADRVGLLPEVLRHILGLVELGHARRRGVLGLG